MKSAAILPVMILNSAMLLGMAGGCSDTAVEGLLKVQHPVPINSSIDELKKEIASLQGQVTTLTTEIASARQAPVQVEQEKSKPDRQESDSFRDLSQELNEFKDQIMDQIDDLKRDAAARDSLYRSTNERPTTTSQAVSAPVIPCEVRPCCRPRLRHRH